MNLHIQTIKPNQEMGMKPSLLQYLCTTSWGSKAALKKLSFTWFWTAFDGFKVGLKPIFMKIRFL